MNILENVKGLYTFLTSDAGKAALEAALASAQTAKDIINAIRTIVQDVAKLIEGELKSDANLVAAINQLAVTFDLSGKGAATTLDLEDGDELRESAPLLSREECSIRIQAAVRAVSKQSYVRGFMDCLRVVMSLASLGVI